MCIIIYTLYIAKLVTYMIHDYIIYFILKLQFINKLYYITVYTMKFSNTRALPNCDRGVLNIGIAAAHDYGSSSTAGSSDFYHDVRSRRTLRRHNIIVFYVVFFIRYAYVLRVFHRKNVGRLQLVRCFPIDHQIVRYFHTRSWNLVIHG